MKNLNEAKKAAINALKSLKQTLTTTNLKNVVDDSIAQIELVCDAAKTHPQYFHAIGSNRDHEAAFRMIEEEAGL